MTATVIGNMTGTAQRIDVPSFAPAVAYVPIAEGSSSAAPVISPSPIARPSPAIRHAGATSAPPAPLQWRGERSPHLAPTTDSALRVRLRPARRPARQRPGRHQIDRREAPDDLARLHLEGCRPDARRRLRLQAHTAANELRGTDGAPGVRSGGAAVAVHDRQGRAVEAR